MTSWTLILCEGAHDQAAISALARVFLGWSRWEGPQSNLPEPLLKTVPEPKRSSRSGRLMQDRWPEYLCKGQHYLVVRALGSDQQVLGASATDFLGQLKPDAVGVFVDANEHGVGARLTSFRETYKKLYPHACGLEAGDVIADHPRLGLWVFPNNADAGSIDRLLIEAARQTRPELFAAGEVFINTLQKIQPGDWAKQWEKALLGAIYQTVRPGASLAVALEKSDAWFAESLRGSPSFHSLLTFLGELSGSAAET